MPLLLEFVLLQGLGVRTEEQERRLPEARRRLVPEQTTTEERKDVAGGQDTTATAEAVELAGLRARVALAIGGVGEPLTEAESARMFELGATLDALSVDDPIRQLVEDEYQRQVQPGWEKHEQAWENRQRIEEYSAALTLTTALRFGRRLTRAERELQHK